MWETIKNDPILKTVTIIILSVLGFGFAFNIMFGSNSGGMDSGEMSGEGMSGGNYSLGNTLSYIFVLAFKLLLIALVIIAIVAVVRLAKKYLLNGGETKMFEKFKSDPVMKGAAIAVVLIFALGLIYLLFTGIFGTGNNYVMSSSGMMAGSSYRYNMMSGSNGYGMNVNVGNGIGLSGILAVLLKFLLFLSVLGLIAGLVMYIKQNYLKDITSKTLADKPKQEQAVQCSKCGAELKPEWKCCPNCGLEKGATP